MGLLSRIIHRIQFRRTIHEDQSINIIDSMAKAKQLYKELSVKAHPDRNSENREIAEDLMKRIVENKQNYAGLLSIQKEIKEKLGK